MPDDLRLRVQISPAQASFKYLESLSTDKERRAWIQTAATDYAARLDVLAKGGLPPAGRIAEGPVAAARPEAPVIADNALDAFMTSPLELGDLSAGAWAQ
jgi:hypothetical protein